MKHLDIAFDAKRAVRNMTGLGNYSRLVVDVMSRTYPGNGYHLYTPVDKVTDRLAPLLERDNVDLRLPSTRLGRMAGGSIWRSVKGLSDQLRADSMSLYHGLSNELPLDIDRAGIPSVLTMHDVIFRRIPSGYSPIDRAIYDFKAARSCRAATRIIAISECTRRDVIEYYNVDPFKVDVVYQGCDDIFRRPVSAAAVAQVRERYGLPERYIIAVGTVEARKNQELAVKALRALPADVKLVIVGRRKKDYTPVVDRIASAEGVTDRIIWLSGVPFGDIPVLLAGACFASYTSRYEGFGIPVIEAISAGVPVIAATGSCLEEAGGPGALYVDPDDVDGYVDYARQLINDPYTGRGMVTAGREYIKRFSPDNFARGIMDTYARAL